MNFFVLFEAYLFFLLIDILISDLAAGLKVILNQKQNMNDIDLSTYDLI